ncbi:DUF4178 domain-containing protein [Parasphingorhabdus sp. DH2-15]|uniref:DUF4178 domain-containing protein n=1 Tax=Parasphingorhabdus sp. DH2-15 TaxID=3444112 RepID=UPI003F6832C8
MSDTATAEHHVPSVRALDCPACGGSLEIMAAGFTTNIVCQYCGSELDAVDPEIKLIARHQEAAANLEIPLGTRGTLRGVEWAAIGYLERSDNWSGWAEYLLFNPYHGYRWLTRTNAGWSFGTPLMKLPNGADKPYFEFDGKRYITFNANMMITTDYVLGEFYWRAHKGDTAVATDYIGVNKMLSEETNGDEISWTLGEWVPFAEMHRAFGTPNNPEWPRTGAAPLPHQPSPYPKDLINFSIIAFVFAAIGLALATFSGLPGQRKSIDISVDYNKPSQEWTLGPIDVPGREGIVTVETAGKVARNSYVDFDFRLVERNTGDQIAAATALERYNGRDADGDWSEEKNDATLKFSSVPAGSYNLEVEATPATGVGVSGPAYNVTLTAYAGGIFLSNYLLFLLLLFTPVLFLLFRHISFVNHRHSESDAADDD